MPGSDNIPWFERLMQDATEAGEFEDLPGAGKPIDDIDRIYEPAWWAKRFMRRERLNDAAIDVAARIRRELPRILAGRDDHAVRSHLVQLNTEIEQLNRDLPDEARLELLDIEQILRDRRKRHP